MDIIAHSRTRPAAVKLAIILLAVSYIVASVVDVVHFQWSYYVICGIWLVEDLLCFILLWCTFRAKNWARWILAVFTFVGVCISFPHFFQSHHTWPAYFIVWFWLSDLMDIVTLIALFHPSSNRWFREQQV